MRGASASAGGQHQQIQQETQEVHQVRDPVEVLPDFYGEYLDYFSKSIVTNKAIYFPDFKDHRVDLELRSPKGG